MNIQTQDKTPPTSRTQLSEATNIPEGEEDWESELMSPKKENPGDEFNRMSAENLGSGDEGERNVNAEIEAFGLSEDDFN